MTSGHTPCACRDCMDVAISSDTTKPELCSECVEAGCEAFPRDDWRLRAMSVNSFECQRDDAYGEEPEEYIYRAYHRRDCPSPWFHSNPGHVCPEPGEC